MNVPVLRISNAAYSALSGSFVTTVHSVFRHAVNIRHGKRLITLLPESMPELANSVHIQLPAGRNFRDFHVETETAVKGEAACMRCRVTFTGSDLALNLFHPHYSRFDYSLGHLAVLDGLDARLARAVEIGRAMAAGRGIGGFGELWDGFETHMSEATLAENREPRDPVCRRARPAILRLVEALRSGCTTDLSEFVVPLLGLGPGLTPSGDDFLIGLIAALFCLNGPAWIHSLPTARLLHEAECQTNALSFTYLSHAFEGRVSAALHRFIHALLGAAPGHLDRAMGDLCSYGSSSGLDTALGAVVGILSAAGSAGRFAVSLFASGSPVGGRQKAARYECRQDGKVKMRKDMKTMGINRKVEASGAAKPNKVLARDRMPSA